MAEAWDELESLASSSTPEVVVPAVEPVATPATTAPWYAQTAYDLGTGALKAGWGLADLITTPAVAVARAGGLGVPYFGISKMGAQDLSAVAPRFGLTEGTTTQQAAEFLTPVPGKGKLDMAKQAGLGLASFLGMKTGETLAPESPYAGLVGALAAPAAALTAGTTAAKIAPSLGDLGDSLQRNALGIRQSDYTKVGKNQIVETISGDYQTQLKRAADELIQTNQLGRSTDPNVLYSNLQDAKKSAEDEIQSVLATVDANRTTGIIPRLDETLDWIKTKAPADKVDFYKRKVNDFLKSLKENGQGSLTYLNQQKKAIGENWRSSPETDPTFWRKFYKDVKENIEKHAPEVKDLNKKKQNLLIVEPVIERGKRAAEEAGSVQRLQKALLYTTGGLGVPGAMYMAGPIGGGLLAGSLALAGTKKGNQIAGRTLSGLSDAFALGASPSATGLAGLLSKQMRIEPEAALSQPQQNEMSSGIEDDVLSQLEALAGVTNDQGDVMGATKQDISLLADEAAAKHGIAPSLVKAVIQAESSFKPDAVSKVGAQGLMQLMPKTAESLGVTDPFDPVQNIEGGVKYLAQLIKKFGSEDLALAAYNWGEGRIRSQLNRLEKKGKPQTLSAILKYGTLPEETQNYLMRIKKVKTEIA